MIECGRNGSWPRPKSSETILEKSISISVNIKHNNMSYDQFHAYFTVIFNFLGINTNLYLLPHLLKYFFLFLLFWFFIKSSVGNFNLKILKFSFKHLSYINKLNIRYTFSIWFHVKEITSNIFSDFFYLEEEINRAIWIWNGLLSWHIVFCSSPKSSLCIIYLRH
jgi:hypothetical protein